jgi:hypothetical protein
MGRSEILEAIRAAVEPLPWVHAMWEGGSASFGRLFFGVGLALAARFVLPRFR